MLSRYRRVTLETIEYHLDYIKTVQNPTDSVTKRFVEHNRERAAALICLLELVEQLNIRVSKTDTLENLTTRFDLIKAEIGDV